MGSYPLILWLFGFAAVRVFAQPQGAKTSSSNLIFDNSDIIVNPMTRLSLNCGVDGTYRSCIWEHGDKSLQVTDVHEGLIKGVSKPEITKGNECGIVIDSVDQSSHGEWSCKVFIIGKTLKGTKNVIVTVRPDKPILDVQMNPLIVTENEETQVSCTVQAARPAARIKWSAGTVDITGHSDSESTLTDDMGTYRTVSTLRYKFQHDLDNRILQCSIEHHTLDEPEYSEVPLDVRYHPYAINSPKLYGIPSMVNEYEIKYNLTSNPQPDARWVVDSEEIPVPAEMGRFQSRIVPLSENFYMVGLKIKDFKPEDIGKSYNLIVSNEVGDRSFDISLNTGPAPPDTMGSGTMAAIIVVVLLIIIILLIIGIMRYRQIYCFGQKDKVKDHLKTSGETLKEEHSDTESAREAAPQKLAGVAPFRNIRMKWRPKKTEEPNLENIEEGEAYSSPGQTASPDKEGDLRGIAVYDNRPPVTTEEE